MSTLTSATTHTSNASLNLLLRGTTATPPAVPYFALFNAAPTDAGGGTEANGGGYARQACAFGPAGEDAARETRTTAPLEWATMPGGVWTHGAILTAAVGGSMLFWGALDAPVTTLAGDPFSIAAGALAVKFLASPMTDYTAHALLNHWLRSESYSPGTSVQLALYDDTDTEVAGGGYARQVQTYAAAASSQAASDNDVVFTNLPDVTLKSAGLRRNPTAGGQELFRKNLPQMRDVDQGATWKCLAGQSVLGID